MRSPTAAPGWRLPRRCGGERSGPQSRAATLPGEGDSPGRRGPTALPGCEGHRSRQRAPEQALCVREASAQLIHWGLKSKQAAARTADSAGSVNPQVGFNSLQGLVTVSCYLQDK